MRAAASHRILSCAAAVLACAAAAPRAARAGVSVADAIGRESQCAGRPITFAVTLSGSYPQDVWVDYATANGTATAGPDYVASVGRIVFPAGSTQASVQVSVVADNVTEADETFQLNLTAASVPIDRAEATGTIHNDRCDDGDPCTADHDSCFGPPAGACRHFDANACATPACALPGACAVDTDHDGLSDAWEQNGYVDVNCNGIDDGPDVDVPLPGASATVPDVYVRYDYMVTTSPPAHDHRPPPLALDIVREAFAAHGVALHWVAPPDGIPEHVVTTLVPSPTRSCVGADSVAMATLRATRLRQQRAAYHYMVFAHRVTCPDQAHCAACPTDAFCGARPEPTATGLADLPGDDTIIATGGYVDTNTPLGIETLASTIMHELGHNFGLKHGADVACVNHKPNYVSVMNYAYQLSGIVVGDAPGSAAFRPCVLEADCGPPVVTSGVCALANACHCTDDLGPVLGSDICFRSDYSSYTALALNEFTPSQGVGGLDEAAGISAPASSEDLVAYFAPGPTTLLAASNGPIDWNADGLIEAHVQADINNDNGHTLLSTWNDWERPGGTFAHLDLRFQCTPGYGLGAPAYWVTGEPGSLPAAARWLAPKAPRR